jgi:hypothetical protein
MSERNTPAWIVWVALALLPPGGSVSGAEPMESAATESAAVRPPRFDGEPQWASIAGTPLSYAANMATPLIRVDSHTYYALENSVWFAATAPAGPWVVAASVPAILYSIPPGSPLHYVTFVRTDAPGSAAGCRPAILGAYAGPNTRVYSTATGCSGQSWVGSPYLPFDAYGYHGYGAMGYAPWGAWHRGPWNSRDRVDHHRPIRR